jgi:hypothetical protein
MYMGRWTLVLSSMEDAAAVGVGGSSISKMAVRNLPRDRGRRGFICKI